ncbi:hypothetical protein [Exiguobacterium aurantiacum]|uniref:hypothetical protein n=1 Tax=Exiguobacterium aurantiacum TaxID=33987 RepID=UPI000B2FF8BE|nr:hypothetical protein [Exiguobacterium aurantiacum]
MLKTTSMFIRHSLLPTKQTLRLRLAPLHAYMLASLVFTIVATVLDYLVLRPDFFAPMWLFLHGFAIFFFYMMWVAVAALFVQLATRLRMKKPWPYRQAWPYAVAMTLVPTLLLVALYHFMPAFLWLGFVVTIVFLTVPLFQIPLKQKNSGRR